MSKKNTTALALATETLHRFHEFLKAFNEEIQKRDLVYLGYSRTTVFEPTDSDFHKYPTVTQYLDSMSKPKRKLTAKDFIYAIEDLDARMLSELVCTKAEYDEFKKNGYNHLRAKWLAEQKKLAAAKAAAKQNNADAIKRKIAKLQAQLDKLVA